jgi:hypothetical protein
VATLLVANLPAAMRAPNWEFLQMEERVLEWTWIARSCLRLFGVACTADRFRFVAFYASLATSCAAGTYTFIHASKSLLGNKYRETGVEMKRLKPR